MAGKTGGYGSVRAQLCRQVHLPSAICHLLTPDFSPLSFFKLLPCAQDMMIPLNTHIVVLFSSYLPLEEFRCRLCLPQGHEAVGSPPPQRLGLRQRAHLGPRSPSPAPRTLRSRRYRPPPRSLCVWLWVLISVKEGASKGLPWGKKAWQPLCPSCGPARELLASNPFELPPLRRCVKPRAS